MERSLLLALLMLALAACSPALTATPTPPVVTATAPMMSDSDAFCPPPRAWVAYVVQPGDTLPELAAATGAATELLLAANCLSRLSRLDSGSIVFLPRQPR